MKTQPKRAAQDSAQALPPTPTQTGFAAATDRQCAPVAARAATPWPREDDPDPSAPAALESGHESASQLTNLPSEAIGLLASRLPPRDLLQFACACRRIHAIAGDRLCSAALCGKARQVVSGRAIDSLLASIQQLPRPLRSEPLAVLTRRSVYLMPAIQESAFHLILQEVPALTDEGRAAVLVELAHLLGASSRQAHALGFDPLWVELARVNPEDRGPCLSALAARLPEGAPMIATRAFERIREEAARLAPAEGAAILNHLARQLMLLPPSRRLLACDQLLSSLRPDQHTHPGMAGAPIDETAPSFRAEILDTLLGQLNSLPGMDRSPLFARLLAASRNLPPHRRARTLTAMAWRLTDVRPEGERLGKFNLMLELTRGLPPGCRHAILNALGWIAMELPAAAVVSAFRALADEARRLPPVPPQTVLNTLAYRLHALPRLERLPMFNELFADASHLPGEQARDLLLALDSRISRLLPVDQAAAAARIAAALRGTQP